MEDTLEDAMRQQLVDGQLPCARAMAIASRLGIEPAAVGLAANQAGIRISHCQLGLFGYGPKAEGKHKIVHAMDDVPERLAGRLRAEAEAGDITCAAVWSVAEALHLQRLKTSSAVEAMGLRVSVCQLGCFPRTWKG